MSHARYDNEVPYGREPTSREALSSIRGDRAQTRLPSIPYFATQLRSFRIPGILENSEKLGHPADQQAFLINLDPVSGRRRKDHMISRANRHPDSGAFPPVNSLADRQNDPVLGRGLGRAGRNDETGVPHPVRFKFLDNDTVKKGFQKMLCHA